MKPPLENPCRKYCGCCKKYKTVKEQDKKCESKRERGRVIARAIYKTKKGNKED